MSGLSLRIAFLLVLSFGVSPLVAEAKASSLPSLLDYVGMEHEVGNGGDAVVCGDGRVMMLDLVEWSYAFTYDFLSSEKPVLENIAHVLNHWRFIDPLLMDRLMKEAQEFEANAVFLGGVDLVDIPDSAHSSVPHGCSIKQIAIRREPMFPQEKRYTVSKDLYDAMDNTHKAGMILHEIIYNWAVIQKHENSIRARYLTALLSSNFHRTINHQEYVKVFKDTNLPISKALVVDTLVVEIERFGNDGTVERGSIVSPQTYRVNDDTTIALEDKETVFFEGSKLFYAPIVTQKVRLVNGEFVNMVAIELDKNRQIVGGRSRPSINLPVYGTCVVSSEGMNFSIFSSGMLRRLWTVGGRIPKVCFPDPLDRVVTVPVMVGYENLTATFYENGIPQKVQISTNTEVLLNVRQQPTISAIGPLSLYESGAVKEAMLGQPVELKTTTGSLKNFTKWTTVKFDADGLVIEK